MTVELAQPIQIARPPDLCQDLAEAQTAKVADGEFRFQRFQMTEGVRTGVELLVVDTGVVRAAICPTRGMSLWRANVGGIDCGWKSPVEGPVHPNFVAVDESSGIGWLDGFDELLVRCGLRSFGAPDIDPAGKLLFPLHGRVGNLAAQNVRVCIDQKHSLLEVLGEIHETRFLQYNLRLAVKYVFALGEPTIEIHDQVLNAGATPTTMQMLYHINVGDLGNTPPVLEEGARLHLNAQRVVARNRHAAQSMNDWQNYSAPTAGFEEQVYFFESQADPQGWASALLTCKDGTRGFAVHYQPETLPYFSQWKNTVAKQDGYVTGLEPATGFPNPRSFEESQGRLVELAPGESRDFRLKLEGISQVQRAQQLAQRIAEQCPESPALVDFDPEWCMPW